MPRQTQHPEILAAIDVGTNAIRVELARPLPDGSLQVVYQERDPVRPGEGVFATGSIPGPVADRVIATLRRYGAICRRDGALLRAVATSAVREARNSAEIVRRAREEAGIELEVVSGREEARLVCLGVLHGKPPTARSLVIDIGGGSTEVALARGESPEELTSVAVGAVRLTEMFGTAQKVTPAKLALVRSYADEAFREGLAKPRPHPAVAIGSSGTINAVVAFAAKKGRTATARELARAAETLATMGIDERRKHFDASRAEIISAGAVILETAVRHLRLESVTSVDTGLRNGVLVDLMRRGLASQTDRSAADAALDLGRRLAFDEKHATHVAALAVKLFEDLDGLHGLPLSARRLLEAAALLHDVGLAVSFHRHHKHTLYLVSNADMPGLSTRERELVATVARYHRRSTPDRHRPDLASFTAAELALVRKLAALLRVANALDASHQQPVREVRGAVHGPVVSLRASLQGPADLELWDADREAAFFRQVFRRSLQITVEPLASRTRHGGARKKPSPRAAGRRAPAAGRSAGAPGRHTFASR